MRKAFDVTMKYEPPKWAVKPAVDVTLSIQDGDVPGKHPIDKPWTLVGRQEEDVDITLKHKSVSRIHAGFAHHQDGRFFIIDLGSTHGRFGGFSV